MAINFSRPGETQLPGGHIGKTADTSAQAPVAQGSEPAAQATPPRGDSVQLSDSALQMRNLSEQLTRSPDSVDSARVAQLQQAVADGSYSIDSRQVADKILDFEARF